MELRDEKITANLDDYQPIGKRVLIRVDAVQTQTAGGIHLPDEVAQAMRPARGVVLAAGPGCEEVKVGDYAVFMMYAGTVVEQPDELAAKEDSDSKTIYRCVRESELFGIWRRANWKYVPFEEAAERTAEVTTDISG